MTSSNQVAISFLSFPEVLTMSILTTHTTRSIVIKGDFGFWIINCPQNKSQSTAIILNVTDMFLIWKYGSLEKITLLYIRLAAFPLSQLLGRNLMFRIWSTVITNHFINEHHHCRTLLLTVDFAVAKERLLWEWSLDVTPPNSQLGCTKEPLAYSATSRH